MKTNEELKGKDAVTTEIYKGCRISGDRAAEHQVAHYSRGDTVVAERMRSGEQLLWRAYAPDASGHTTVALQPSGAAYDSAEKARAAVDRHVEVEKPRWTDIELSSIYRCAFEAHPSRHADPALALASAGETLAEHLAPGQTGLVDQEALTWVSDDAEYEALSAKIRRLSDELALLEGAAKGSPEEARYLALHAEYAAALAARGAMGGVR